MDFKKDLQTVVPPICMAKYGKKTTAIYRLRQISKTPSNNLRNYHSLPVKLW